MTDPKTVTVQERLREVVTLLQDVQEASEAPQQLKLAIALGNIDAVLEAQSERASMEGEIAERVATEIDRYGEGLVPELRMVCDWLASHFRNDEDARAAFTFSKTGDE